MERAQPSLLFYSAPDEYYRSLQMLHSELFQVYFEIYLDDKSGRHGLFCGRVGWARK